MSFTTQPAPRISNAPTRNSATSRRSARPAAPAQQDATTGRAGTAATRRSAGRAAPAAHRARQAPGSRATQPLVAISVYASSCVLLRARQHVRVNAASACSTSAAGGGRATSAATPAQAHYLGSGDAPRGRRRGAAVQRPRRRMAGDASRDLRASDRSVAGRALPRPQAPEPDLWLVFAPLKRDATDLVVREGDRARRRGAAAGVDRAHQHRPAQRRPAARHRHRGRRAMRAADRARASRRAAPLAAICSAAGRRDRPLLVGDRAAGRRRAAGAAIARPGGAAGRAGRRFHAGGA